MPDKLPAPCRIENRDCEAGAYSWQHANQSLPELEIELVGQEPSLPDKLPAPCRIEDRACEAGAIPAR